jgi:spore germination protein GerM
MRHMKLLICMVLIITSLAACTEQPGDIKEKSKEFNTLSEEELEEGTLPKDASDTAPGASLYALQQVDVTLYFYDEKANQLSPETRPMTKLSDISQAQFVIRELINGPKTSSLKPVIPADVKLNKVDYAEDILSVDLSSEFVKSEYPAVSRAALINSLLELGTFKYVKLFIDGKEITQTGENKSVVLGLMTRYPSTVPEIIAYEAQNTEGTDIRKVNRELFFQDNQGMYLLPEVRSITITGGNYAEAIVNELLKGPVAVNEGFYPTLPKGTTLQKSEIIDGEDGVKGIALYFSKEFRTQFAGGSSQEIAMLSSLVYSLASLPDINFVKVFYENEEGQYIDEPIHNISLDQGLTRDHFPNMIGKRIRVYFGDREGMLLVPEYRAVSRDEADIPELVLAELASNPINPNSVRVIPPHISHKDIKVSIEKNMAIVDIPSTYFNEAAHDNNRIIRDLYAVVNSLTDPMNLCGIREVQFTVEGKTIEMYKEISLKDPFVMNPALIHEEQK